MGAAAGNGAESPRGRLRIDPPRDAARLARDASVNTLHATLSTMKAARAKVVKGKIVTRAKFPEGAELTITST
jgi:hypothetical protein